MFVDLRLNQIKLYILRIDLPKYTAEVNIQGVVMADSKEEALEKLIHSILTKQDSPNVSKTKIVMKAKEEDIGDNDLLIMDNIYNG